MAVSGIDKSPQHSLQTDKDALLEFKKSIKVDPKLVLSNWNETTEVCRFNGIVCKNGNRVGRIALVGAGLVGPFSPVIGNLTALRTINLSDNSLYGNIPFGISSLRHLRNLYLDNNSLQGPIPGSLSSLSNLTLLALGNNGLHGEIPPSLFSNCSLLSNLDLSFNLFSGKIPPEIGNCPKLWNLNLYNNQFTGEIPLSLANASEMYNLDVESNNLSGELPSKLVSKLTQLLNLHLSYNQMVSHDRNSNLDIFFTALSNCSMLRELELAGMGLGGTLPDSIRKLGVNFSYMLLQENKIYGSVPSVIANLSSLIYLNLTMNHLNGTISPEISRLPRLDKLWLSYNVFTGEIPEEIGQFRHLGELELSHNRFTGKIPESLGNLVSLISLSLNNNQLSGKIPSTLGNCIILSSLDLSYNRLTGNIPSELSSAMRRNAIFLNLSHNRLEGLLPSDLSKLETIKEINLSFNKLTGTIFPKISSYMALETLDLSCNSFQGQLPEFLTKLTSLEVFDVSNNSLSGKIPTGLSKIDSLKFLNLSFNDFNGRVPEGGIFDSITNLSFLGNRHLCGHVSGLPFCSHKKKYFHSPVFLVIFYVGILVFVLVTAICCVIGWRYLKRIVSSKARPETESQPELTHNFPRITYKELAEATGGFSDNRLLGSGGYGRVFKGSLPDGTQIAVKVLQLQTGNSTKSFNRECQVLKRIRHRNLIRIITACSLPDFKALVLPFMANGSLDNRLYPDSDSSDLNLIQRVNICSDIAEGMAYLHHHSPIKVIHCDLKPSNVLLNDDMTALVSDFGIAKLVMTIGSGSENLGNSTANILCGSIGYIPPGDMFSEGISLHNWVKRHYHRRMEDVVDSSLVRTTRDQSNDVKKMWEVAIGELLEMGILCTQESPASRPTMMDAAGDLDRLKRYLGGDTTATFASSLGISSSTISDD
ncbi:putative leucine-rich repeat receptor-like serine/threonine-protein kinase At2g24130 [Cynara cardunculus var. scolymus]|uniref:putative leucine-rich repeat receptor-like serine/threonine-protein kinase At2g24130 n=1 Tax=Cynara cardunculus var. scolymus TaxID=59895 RepID=UPI000D625B24|nr:putative leucine-rich repeat receptor-like serine/threonine-protein kinase At2g24130 [Cynara cardunculus var. scolymus]